jgi:hypothetical protein
MHQIKHVSSNSVVGSDELYTAVRAAFVAQGSSLAAWCKAKNVNRQTAEKALRGRRHSRLATELRERLVAEVLCIEDPS